MTDLVSSETIAEITQTFWGAYLPDAGDLTPGSHLPAVEDVRGRVDIDGAWSGCVEVSCSIAVAREVASVMFGTPASDIAEADVRDAVGELVNVVGGNIKSILPAPTSLSVPILDDASEWRFAAELQSEVLLAWADEPIVVRVWRPGAGR
ncbi:MAG TPA: chemotaxis protein CheX [Acidimicrobiales bacterium]|nr:chemotaxis protein CheX [Acidimicrobiales bacterium]